MMTNNEELVAFDIIDEFIDTQKREMHESIRKWRNNLIRLTIEMQDQLTMADVIRINKMKTFLDTIDYGVDNGWDKK